jgi:hypothetical protein
VSYFPSIDEHLVVALQEQFPDKAPDLGQTQEEVWFMAGQVSVVRWLRQKCEDQDEFYLKEEN